MLWVGFFSFLAVGLMTFALPMVLGGTNDPLSRRLQEIRKGPGTLVKGRAAASGPLGGLFGRAGSLLGGLGSSRDNDKVRQWLAWAGFEGRHVVGLYVLLRVAAGLGVALMTGLLGSLALPGRGFPWAVTLGAGLLATLFVKSCVDRRVKARREVLEKSLPTVLDLLVVTVEAGLGLNMALARVAEETSESFPLFSRLLTQTHMEMRAGSSRADSLRRLSWRCGLEEVKSLVSLLIQADQYGTSIGESLRVYSDTLRTKRRQRAEEAAAKTAVKLVFPLVMFIFPALLIVLLGGALLRVFQDLGPLLGK